MTGGQTEIEYLFELYHSVGARLCERLGHDWDTIRTQDGTAKPMNAQAAERCRRCDETRLEPTDSTSTTTHTEPESSIEDYEL